MPMRSWKMAPSRTLQSPSARCHPSRPLSGLQAYSDCPSCDTTMSLNSARVFQVPTPMPPDSHARFSSPRASRWQRVRPACFRRTSSGRNRKVFRRRGGYRRQSGSPATPGCSDGRRGGIGRHVHDVAVILQSHHEHRFADRRFEVPDAAGLVRRILARKDLGRDRS